MKQYRNRWIAVLMLPVLIGQLGCDKFLDRKPLGSAIQGDVQQGAAEQQVFALYDGTRFWGMSQLPFLMLHSARSDDADKGSTVTDGADMESIVDNFDYVKDHWMLNAYWDEHYTFIGLANNVIHLVDSLQLTDQPSLVNKAEAMFMRAWAYFDLVRTYGEVPKIDFKVYTVADANKPKSTVAAIYALIDADLTYAVTQLPLQWESKFIGRVTRGAANALHAKTYLYRQNWGSALGKAEAVIASTVYSLYTGTDGKHATSYGSLFSEPGENNVESIFEVQNFEAANGSRIISNEYTNYQGVRGSGEWDLGWGWNAPTAALVNSYDAGDPRKNETILYSGQSDGVFGATVPTAPPLARAYWNKKVYTDPARRAATGDRFGKWLNMILMRYADVLLVASEAANELGGAANTTKALNYLEMVRARARGSAAVLPPITTTDQAQLRDAIRKERRAELGMEYERFFDLVRWGIAQSTFASMGKNFEPRDKYYPLPQGAIDKSGGVLIQNPDYP